jgi:periplasmic divalent cation tolerance protein
MTQPTLLYVTCAKHEEARRIARTLLEERLIACANIMPPHTAVYRWEGSVQEEPEVAMLLKTQAEMTGRISERIRELHSYSVPCVVALPIQGGNPDFLTWIEQEVTSE